MVLDYSEAFRLFLNHTDEKEVFLCHLKSKLDQLRPRGILDIGAGSGELSVPIRDAARQYVRRYVAVEQDSKHVQMLRNNGIPTIQGEFPACCHDFGEQFDFVLASHSLPSSEEKREIFIVEAASRLTRSGTMVLVTFDDEVGHWHDLLSFMHLDRPPVNPGGIARWEKFLKKKLRFIKHTTMKTIVQTSKILDMHYALAFVYSNGNPEMYSSFLGMQDELSKYLVTNFTDDIRSDTLVFPFVHHWFEVGV